MDSRVSCLRRAQNLLAAFVLMKVAVVLALLAVDWWQRRAVAVDLRLLASRSDREWVLAMDWFNRRDCGYVKGSLKFVGGDPADLVTPRVFWDIFPTEKRGSRGIGPQHAKVSVSIPEHPSPVFYVVAEHWCGNNLVRSTMGVFKTSEIFQGE